MSYIQSSILSYPPAEDPDWEGWALSFLKNIPDRTFEVSELNLPLFELNCFAWLQDVGLIKNCENRWSLTDLGQIAKLSNLHRTCKRPKPIHIDLSISFQGITQLASEWASQLDCDVLTLTRGAIAGMPLPKILSLRMAWKRGAQDAADPQTTTNRDKKRLYVNATIEHNGKQQTIKEWSKETGLPADLISKRISNYSWPIEKALTEPISKKHSRLRQLQRNSNAK